MELITRSSRVNSLWSVVYCLLSLVMHVYIAIQAISRYRKLNNDAVWDGETPGEVRAYIGFIVLSLLVLPVFIFFSFIKVGNTANDGTKLGRDHALDYNKNTLGNRIRKDQLRYIWENFPPFSPLLQLLAAFLVLIPEMILTATEIKRGIMSSGLYSHKLIYSFLLTGFGFMLFKAAPTS